MSKTGQKITGMKRVAKYVSVDERSLVFKSFLESQFSYCSLIWMFHNRTLNLKINALHERAYDSYRFHHKNIQILAVEMFKRRCGLSP